MLFVPVAPPCLARRLFGAIGEHSTQRSRGRHAGYSVLTAPGRVTLKALFINLVIEAEAEAEEVESLLTATLKAGA